MPDTSLFGRQVADEFGKQIDLHACRLGIVALAAAGHWPVIGGIRHTSEHFLIYVTRENPVEFEMIKGRLNKPRRIYRGANEISRCPSGGGNAALSGTAIAQHVPFQGESPLAGGVHVVKDMVRPVVLSSSRPVER